MERQTSDVLLLESLIKTRRTLSDQIEIHRFNESCEKNIRRNLEVKALEVEARIRSLQTTGHDLPEEIEITEAL